MRLLASLCFTCCFASAQDTAEAIMARVAANMDKSIEHRKDWVYTQTSLSRLLRTNAKLVREENREYLVVPTATGTEHKLVSFSGRYQPAKEKQPRPYTKPDDCDDTPGADCELIGNFTKNMLVKDSRDGVEKDVFPLRSTELPHYEFHLKGKETFRGRSVWRIAFSPRPGKSFDEKWDHPWSGEALIDTEEDFPLQIQSRLAPKIPFAVRAFLGTNLKQTGFSATYRRVEPGVWFPATYGTEFQLDVLFVYKRVITLNMETKDFRRAAANSNIEFDSKAIIEK